MSSSSSSSLPDDNFPYLKHFLFLLFLTLLNLTNAQNFQFQSASSGQVMTAANCDFFGNDLLSGATTSTSVDDCGSQCVKNSNCNHFTYITSNKDCWLKNAINPSPTFLSVGICGYVPSRPNPSTNALNFQSANSGQIMSASNCDFPGNDIVRIPGPITDCGSYCASNINCDHFTYGNNYCWLKQADNPVASSAQGALCGYVVNRTANAYFNFILASGGLVMAASGCDFNGNDIGSTTFPYNGNDNCAGQCASNPGCDHFTYNPATTTCWFKKANSPVPTGSSSSASGSVYCGYVINRPLVFNGAYANAGIVIDQRYNAVSPFFFNIDLIF